jgi:hypothetical protein
MSLEDVFTPPVVRILVFIVLYIILAIVVAFLVERSLVGALKGLKLALKAEFTTDAGKLNFFSIFFLTVLALLFNLHVMVSDSVKVGQVDQGDHVLGPLIVLGIVFLGSVICVLLLERKKSP